MEAGTDVNAPAAVVERYVEAFARRDLDALLGLFAEDAIVEDPVGGPRRRGREALREFYAESLALGARPVLTGRVRVAGRELAFPLRIDVALLGIRVHVIGTMQLTGAGRIGRLRLYFDDDSVESC